MADDTTMVHVTHGPYAGGRLTLSSADAQSAISEGWAIDPFAEKPKRFEWEGAPPEILTEDQRRQLRERDEPKQVSDEDRARITERAHAAARRLRGEDEHGGGKPTRAVAAGAASGGEYETRDAGRKTK